MSLITIPSGQLQPGWQGVGQVKFLSAISLHVLGQWHLASTNGGLQHAKNNEEGTQLRKQCLIELDVNYVSEVTDLLSQPRTVNLTVTILLDTSDFLMTLNLMY